MAQIKLLLERTNCKAVIYSQELKDVLVQVAFPVQVQIDALDMLLSTEAPDYPFEKAFDEALNDPILIIHSSGTTGDPKTITMSHGTVSVTDNDRFIPCPPGRKPQNAAQFDYYSVPDPQFPIVLLHGG